MSNIFVKCIQDVIHGPFNLSAGQRGILMDSVTANDLAQFVEPDEEMQQKMDTAVVSNKMMPEGDLQNKTLTHDLSHLGQTAQSLEAKLGGEIEQGTGALSAALENRFAADGAQGNESPAPSAPAPSEPEASSASPAAPVFEEKIVKPSSAGATKKKGAR